MAVCFHRIANNQEFEMKTFFHDSEGNPSMMRLLSFILVISGIVCALVTKSIPLSSMLIGFGVGGKVVQKFKK